MSALIVTAAGPYSTLQDRGRFGYLRFGVATAGAVDPLLLAAANALVGNPVFAAGVEMTLAGDTYRVEADSVRIAVAGGAAPTIDGAAAPAWRSHLLRRGQVLRVGAIKDGARAYLAVAGGFAVAPTLGSVSTHPRTGLGGLDGGKLKDGDALPLALAIAPAEGERVLPPGTLPPRGPVLRVVLGPQDDYFDAGAIAAFLAAPYKITPEADRMGYRLDGPAIRHAKGFNIVSDGIALGAIQVPGNGQPIVLMPDRGSTGGYPKIACVIAADLAALAQMKPGENVRFAAITPAEAHAAAREFATLMADLPRRVAPLAPPLDSARLLGLNLIGGAVDMRE